MIVLNQDSVLRDIIKYRGDTLVVSFSIPEDTESLLFLVRNERNMPLLSLDSNSMFLEQEGSVGTLQLCHPSADSFAHDSSVYVSPNGRRCLFFAISATTKDQRLIVLRGDYILRDDVITGGIYEAFMPPTPAFEGLPYAILRALTLATQEGVASAELPPDEIVTEADMKRSEIAATIQKMKSQGVLPTSQEFETILITDQIVETGNVMLKKRPKPDSVYFRVAGVPHQERGKDYIVNGNLIILDSEFASRCLGLYMNISYFSE